MAKEKNQQKDIKILIDDRERDVIPYFGDQIEVKRLDVADYQIFLSNVLVALIERKTWADLAASIMDGRKNNIHKLLSLSDNKIKIYYIIEGEYIESSYNAISKKNLVSHLDHLTWRDGVHILYTSSINNTVERIYELARNISTCKDHPKIEVVKKIDGAGKVEIKIERNIPKEILQCFDGIGEKKSETLLKNGMDLPHLLYTAMNNPEDIKYTDLRNDIVSLLQGDKAKIKYILSVIPGISNKSAQYIIEKNDLGEILRGYSTLEDIAKLKKSQKAAIGKKCATLIMEYICARN